MLSAKEYTGTVTGTVFSTEAGERVDSVHIVLGDSLYSVYSDTAGVYTITGVAPGTYTMRVMKTGYVSGIRYSVAVRPRSVTVEDFVLAPDVT